MGYKVATIELISYQGTLVPFQRTGEFDYDICNPMPADPSAPPPSALDPDPLPLGVTVSMIQNTIGMWENTVKWHDDAVGANIVQATGHEVETCIYPGKQAFSLGHRHQVAFYNGPRTNLLCQSMTALACWTLKVDAIEIELVQAPPLSIVMRSPEDWGVENAGGCTKLQETLVHESGHSFGFGHAVTGDSIMYHLYDPTRRVCEPTAYDVAAMTANYQSR